MSLYRVFDIAGTGLTAQALRLNTTASNIANAESVSSNLESTYRGRHPVFAAEYDNAMSEQGAGGKCDGRDGQHDFCITLL
jgi:flagellar basal-body rod protein FlgC